jgi:hypothetical protein
MSPIGHSWRRRQKAGLSCGGLPRNGRCGMDTGLSPAVMHIRAGRAGLAGDTPDRSEARRLRDALGRVAAPRACEKRRRHARCPEGASRHNREGPHSIQRRPGAHGGRLSPQLAGLVIQDCKIRQFALARWPASTAISPVGPQRRILRCGGRFAPLLPRPRRGHLPPLERRNIFLGLILFGLLLQSPIHGFKALPSQIASR